MNASTKINFGELIRYIQSLDVSDDEAMFLEELFYISQSLFLPSNCANFVKIDLPINFEKFKKFASKYGFFSINIKSKNYIGWQKTSLPELAYCDIAEFFRRIQRCNNNNSRDSLQRLGIYKEICFIMPNLNYAYSFCHIFPIHWSFFFNNENEANSIAREYGLYVVSGDSKAFFLSVADSVKAD